MIYYISDSDGNVVGQFDGPKVDIKEDHTQHYVETIDELPGVDVWDTKYE